MGGVEVADGEVRARDADRRDAGGVVPAYLAVRDAYPDVPVEVEIIVEV